MSDLHFISCDSPIPFAAADSLCKLLSSNSSDLSGRAILLPTRSATRTLRFALLDAFSKIGIRAFAGLDFYTPESFLSKFSAGICVVNQFESESAWRSVFDSLRPSDVASLFPRGLPTPQDFSALALAISRLRRTLAEVDLDIQSAMSKSCVASCLDFGRWRELANMEGAYRRKLSAVGLIAQEDVVAVALENFKRGARPFGDLRELFVIGICDMSERFVRILREFKHSGVNVKIMVFADEQKSSSFDEWGRPNSDWDCVSIPLAERDIFSTLNPVSQVEFAAEIFSNYGAKCGEIAAIACAEPDSVRVAKSAFSSRGIEVYSPDGISLSEDARADFLRAFADWSFSGDIADFSKMLRNRFVFERASEVLGMSASSILQVFDEFVAEKFPICLESARDLARGCSRAEKLFEFLGQIFIDGLRSRSSVSEKLRYLAEEFFVVRASLASESVLERGRRFEEVFASLLDEIARAEGVGLAPADMKSALNLCLDLLGRVSIPEEKSSFSVALLDWLELFWSPQPHLVLCDVNEGILPSTSFGDAFLTNSQREALGILSVNSRRRRDIYMLWVLARSRANGGMLTVIAPRRRGDGSPAKPSRLLLACDDSQLKARVEKLFGEVDSSEDTPAFKKSWILKIPYGEIPHTLSPSALKTYIKNPFAFYLERVLKMEMFDQYKRELDAMDFGTLVHAVMESFALTSVASSGDEAKVADCLSDILDKKFREFFGTNLSAPLRFQREAARRILRSAARAQSSWARDWQIIQTETPRELVIAGVPIKMRIDRIDRNSSGDIVVIDYKTYNSFPPDLKGFPATKQEHLSIVHNVEEIVSSLPNPSPSSSEIVWKDLQLPLYVEAVKKDFPNAKISCAHFALSRDSESCRISLWEISEEELASALRRAEEIVVDIKDRKFDPPEKLSPFDSWREYFPFADGDIKDFIEFEEGSLK